ncbi:MAG: MBL fold metallo-hydrolase [Roseibium sp.]|uniref:MBL fold metallo-hydrolase n=1 Tax=Roseibium sp. TaxID=1936156 RepID=UPI00261DFED9|nr:MBL fold metallo-hydrolase [Roseibium sp.]MCV0426853.1 MBL fold metallo-hydrolase [Roseibium sp.]
MSEAHSPDCRDRLVILGSKGGPAIRPGGPSPTSSLLEIGGRLCVVDCGLGVTRGLVEAGIVLKDLDLIFITHLHSDHVLELGPLVHTAWCTGLSHQVKIYGPADLIEYWEGFLNSMRYDIETRIDDEGRPDLRDLVQIHLLQEGSVPLEDETLAIEALQVDHPPVVDCYALKFEAGGWSVVFSADTAYFPPLADFAEGADILVHEAMLERGVDRIVEITGNGERLREHLLASHTMAPDAAKTAEAAGVKTLVLNHLIPADLPGFEISEWQDATKAFSGETIISHDGLAITRS